jgi:hypothetical protein
MMDRRRRVGAIRMLQLLLVSLAAGCPGVAAEYRPFFRLPMQRQPEELLRQPLERQLDIYIAGMTGVHPPRSDLGLVIGGQGPAIMPALLSRMRLAREDYIKAHLVWILRGMPCTPSLDGRVRAGLDSVRVQVAAIRDSTHRETAEQNLKYAENRCRPATAD